MVFKILIDGTAHEIDIVRRRPHLVVRIDGREREISVTGEEGDGRHSVEIDGTLVHFARAHLADRQILRFAGRNFEALAIDPRSGDAAGGGGMDEIKAPMPGSVVEVHKKLGEPVQRGELVITIESMKLQTGLVAPREGVIAAILRAAGETFDKDEVVASLEKTDGKA